MSSDKSIHTVVKYNDAEYVGDLEPYQSGGQVGGDAALDQALVERATAETTLHITYYKLMLFNEQLGLLNKLKEFYEDTTNASIITPKIQTLTTTIDELNKQVTLQKETLKEKNKEAQSALSSASEEGKITASVAAAIAAKDLLEKFNIEFKQIITNTFEDMTILTNDADDNKVNEIKPIIDNYKQNATQMVYQVREIFATLQESAMKAQDANDRQKEKERMFFNYVENESNLVTTMKQDLIETFNPLHYSTIIEVPDTTPDTTIASTPATTPLAKTDKVLTDDGKTFYQKVMVKIRELNSKKIVDDASTVSENDKNKSAQKINVIVNMKGKDGKSKGTYSGNLTRKTTFTGLAYNVGRNVKDTVVKTRQNVTQRAQDAIKFAQNVGPSIKQKLGIDVGSKKSQIQATLDNPNPTLDIIVQMVNNIEDIKKQVPDDADLSEFTKKTIAKINGLIKDDKDDNNGLSVTDKQRLDGLLIILNPEANPPARQLRREGGKTRNKRRRPRRRTTYKHKSNPK